MRVLTVGNMYPPHHLGGYEQDWAAGVAALRAAGHEVEVLTTEHREPGVADIEEPGVWRELQWYWHDHDFPPKSYIQRLDIELANAIYFHAALLRLEPDVVSWWPMGGMSLSLIEWARMRGLRSIGVVYDDWMVYGPRV